MRFNATVLLLPALLSACGTGTSTAPAASNDAAPSEATAAPGGVVRETPPPPTPAPYQPAAAIQTQPGPGGTRIDLTRVAVTGDVLTVQIAASHPQSAPVRIKLDDVSVVDDATSQRYSVLKDNSGKWMAAPLQGNDDVAAYPSKGQSEVLWFKFPAPPATSKTVSVNLPGIGPFDGVPVTR